MKIIKVNGLKPEFVNLDYNVIKEELERCEKKGKTENVNSLSKLLNNLEEDSSVDVIETEVNKIIDCDNEKLKEIKSEIKRLEKEISLLSHFSERETDSDVLPTIIANL